MSRPGWLWIVAGAGCTRALAPSDGEAIDAQPPDAAVAVMAEAGAPPVVDAGPDHFAVRPRRADFGGVVVTLTPSDPVVFEVTNHHHSPAASAITAETQESAFTAELAEACYSPLLPGRTCAIAVRFTPSYAREFSGLLTVRSGASVDTALLVGRGLTQARLITSLPTNEFVAAVGATSAPFSFTVANIGDVAAGVLTTMVSGRDADDFVLTGTDCIQALGSHASCQVHVAFRPRSPGPKSASVWVQATPGGSAGATFTGVNP